MKEKKEKKKYKKPEFIKLDVHLKEIHAGCSSGTYYPI